MPNAGKIIGRWPGLYETLDPLCGHSPGLKTYRWDGQLILDQTFVPPVAHAGETAEEKEKRAAYDAMRKEAPMFDCHRGDLVSPSFPRFIVLLTQTVFVQHQTLLDYAISVGVQVKQGVAIAAYEEDESGPSVVIDGENIRADVVIGADGELRMFAMTPFAAG